MKRQLTAILMVMVLCLSMMAGAPVYADAPPFPLDEDNEEVPFSFDDEEVPVAPPDRTGEDPKEEAVDTYAYDVPVQLMHAYENKASMGNPALEHTARVIVKDNGETQVRLRIQGLHFMNMYGHVWNFFHEEGGSVSAAEVSQWQEDKNLVGGTQTFPYEFLLNRQSGKEGTIRVKVWVDAMDAIASGGAKNYGQIQPGSGEQGARLVLDWDAAALVARYSSSTTDVFASGSSTDADALREEGEQTEEENEVSSESSSASSASTSASSSVVSNSTSTGGESTPEEKPPVESKVSDVSAMMEKSEDTAQGHGLGFLFFIPVLIIGLILGIWYWWKNKSRAK